MPPLPPADHVARLGSAAGDDRPDTEPDVDVLIVGAGIAGVGMACHLEIANRARRDERRRPFTYLVVEARARIGGTWDVFRFPGVRADSDMHTLSYRFRPWRGDVTVPTGDAIRRYVEDTAVEYGVVRRTTFETRVTAASWDGETHRWTVTLLRADRSTSTVTCRWLQMCSGYYAYDIPHRPSFPGEHDFAGPIVHPQHWPDDLDVGGRRVVVIGSGATAVTLVPALVDPQRTRPPAAHVTMLQRSPSWVVAGPTRDPLSRWVRRLLPGRIADPALRTIFAARNEFVYRTSRKNPAKVRAKLHSMIRSELAGALPIDPHFTPSYDPWDQRLCLAADADLFTEIRRGRVDVVTDTIARFTASGIELASGRRLAAEVVVAATGLELLTLGGVRIDVDGAPVDFSERVTYKSFMYSGIANLGTVFGYVNASWTLRADLVADYVVRMLTHMDAVGATAATPVLPAEPMALRPYVDDRQFNPGYMQRRMHLYPKQGDREPWVAHQSYWADRRLLGRSEVDDGVVAYGRTTTSDAGSPPRRPVGTTGTATPTIGA